MSSDFPVIDRRIGLESYIFAQAYSKVGILHRGVISKLMFESLSRVKTGTEPLFSKLNESDRMKVERLLQLEIIAKIMTLTEDLGVFGYAFLNEPKKLLDLIMGDAGKITWDFLNPVETYTSEQLYKLFGYPSLTSTGLEGEQLKLIMKHLDGNITEARRALLEIRDFRKNKVGERASSS